MELEECKFEDPITHGENLSALVKKNKSKPTQRKSLKDDNLHGLHQPQGQFHENANYIWVIITNKLS